MSIKKFAIFSFLCAWLGAGSLFSCTLVSVQDGEGGVFAASNNDTTDLSYGFYFVEPGDGESYGALYFGADNDKQSGINERGLFFSDAKVCGSTGGWLYAHDRLEDGPTNQYRAFMGTDYYEGDLRRKMMQECSTVEEAIALFCTHKTYLFAYVHMLVADSSGHCVIIEYDGKELQFLPGGERVSVVTNFPLSLFPEASSPAPCWRYKRAKEQLEGSQASAETCRSALSASCQPETLYSLVADLRKGRVSLFFQHNYDHAVDLIVVDELKKGPRTLKIAALFSEGEKSFTNRPSQFTRIGSECEDCAAFLQGDGHCGHFPHAERPEVYFRYLKEFFQ